MQPHSGTQAPAKAIASMADIQKIVAQIVTPCCPQKVILFGSYAYGSPTEDSDVDLLVIMETEGVSRRTS